MGLAANNGRMTDSREDSCGGVGNDATIAANVYIVLNGSVLPLFNIVESDFKFGDSSSPDLQV